MQLGASVIAEEIRKKFDELADTQIVRGTVEENDPEYKELVAFFADVKGKRILDVGCGKGKFARALMERGALITGIDPSPRLLEYARSAGGGTFEVGSATDLRLEDGAFDGVFAVEVIEHIPDFAGAIAEMTRVLRKGGKICIIDKNRLGLTQRRLVPIILVKKIREYTNRWMYPRGFPYRERWFFAWEIKRELIRRCSSTDVKYLIREDGGRLTPFFRICPCFNLLISWRGVK
jgi:ubiquinone/menaquinone biosynthesis C-methylase UbiE